VNDNRPYCAALMADVSDVPLWCSSKPEQSGFRVRQRCIVGKTEAYKNSDIPEKALISSFNVRQHIWSSVVSSSVSWPSHGSPCNVLPFSVLSLRKYKPWHRWYENMPPSGQFLTITAAITNITTFLNALSTSCQASDSRHNELSTWHKSVRWPKQLTNVN